MISFDEIEFKNWKPVSEDFLYENFINDPVLTVEEKKMVEIDPSKIYFSETPFDRYYYKQKFPCFDDEICQILERCSIEKMKKNNNLPKIKEETDDENDKKPSKKSAVEFKKENFIVEFD